MLLNIGINKKTAELSNRKENLTKNVSLIMSISHFMRKIFVEIPNPIKIDDDDYDDVDDTNYGIETNCIDYVP